MNKGPQNKSIAAQVGPLLSQVSRLWDVHLNATLAFATLNRVHWAMLVRLLKADSPLSQAELAHSSCVEPTALTAPLDHLERLGYIERLAHPRDRRVKLVAIRADARDRLTDVAIAVSALRSTLFTTVPDADISITIKTLTKIKDNLLQRPARNHSTMDEKTP